jgi:hypothetical protein
MLIVLEVGILLRLIAVALEQRVLLRANLSVEKPGEIPEGDDVRIYLWSHER